MTHPLGKETVNVSINVTREERAILGRASFAHDARSLGDFLKRAYLAELERQDPDVAHQITEARRRHKAAALLGVGLVAVWLSFVPNRADDTTQWLRARTTRRQEQEMEAAA